MMGTAPVKTDSYFQKASRVTCPPKPMIQIIDRNTARRTAAERLLRQAGYVTQSFRSAPEFLTAAFQLPIDRARPGELRARLERLTPRETEVFTRVVLGQPNKQVADEIGTVEQTVKFHRKNVMAKMEAMTFADLVRMAERLGIACIEE